MGKRLEACTGHTGSSVVHRLTVGLSDGVAPPLLAQGDGGVEGGHRSFELSASGYFTNASESHGQ
jgi:hypothetical protein